jgi:hypothetical protein
MTVFLGQDGKDGAARIWLPAQDSQCERAHSKPSLFDKLFHIANIAIFTIYTTFKSNHNEIQYLSQGCSSGKIYILI